MCIFTYKRTIFKGSKTEWNGSCCDIVCQSLHSLSVAPKTNLEKLYEFPAMKMGVILIWRCKTVSHLLAVHFHSSCFRFFELYEHSFHLFSADIFSLLSRDLPCSILQCIICSMHSIYIHTAIPGQLVSILDIYRWTYHALNCKVGIHES